MEVAVDCSWVGATVGSVAAPVGVAPGVVGVVADVDGVVVGVETGVGPGVGVSGACVWASLGVSDRRPRGRQSKPNRYG